jgi:hypothetical protein
MSVARYREDNDQKFPPSLNDALAGVEVGDATLLRCPALPRVPSTGAEDLNSLGYYYIDWSLRGTNEPGGDYPLIYDARLRSHAGGINVVCVDGTVFWDIDARRVKKFAADHPEAKLPLPTE